MKFLVIGLGSMGKRRIRCLKALGHTDITGFDPRQDRAEETAKSYGVKVTQDFKSLQFASFDAFVISTPPNLHNFYLKLALEFRKPSFVEASVLLDGLEEITAEAKAKNVFLAPSTTLRYHPIVRDIREIVQSKKYGKITNFSYVSGQYLPDWHPWEPITDFYVSKKETGGAREIVPFELTWMSEVFGWPEQVQGLFGKTMDLGADIDDTYALNLKYKGFIGQLMVDVVARHAQRRLVINLEQAQITWDWNDNAFKVFEAQNQRHVVFEQPVAASASGYNKNIIEQMYIEEVSAFIQGIKNSSAYPNTMEDDMRVLKILLASEKGQ